MKPDFGVPVMLAVPSKEIDKIVARAKKRILAYRGDAPGYEAYFIQSSMTQELEDAALEWADAETPDLSRVLAQLVLLRQFRKMLKAIPPKKKAKRK